MQAGQVSQAEPHLLPRHAASGEHVKVAVRHIPREENAQADLMSNRAIDERL